MLKYYLSKILNGNNSIIDGGKDLIIENKIGLKTPEFSWKSEDMLPITETEEEVSIGYMVQKIFMDSGEIISNISSGGDINKIVSSLLNCISTWSSTSSLSTYLPLMEKKIIFPKTGYLLHHGKKCPALLHTINV